MPEKFPVADSFWYHATSSQMKWKDLASTKFLASAMTVSLQGDFHADAATAILAKNYNIAADKGGDIEICVINQGLSPIGNFSYTIMTDGGDTTGICDLPSSEATAFSRAAIATVSLPAGLNLGDQTFSIRIDDVNDSKNAYCAEEFASSLQVLPFVPVNRPLLEEYTGLRCGWCPEGYVLLKQLSEEYGHELVAMAFHSSAFEAGAMVYLTQEEFPYLPGDYPFAQINRNTVPTVSIIPQVWGNARKSLADGEVVATLQWADDAHSSLHADVTARFIKDFDDSSYSLAIGLVADGLSSPTWLQSNSYSSYTYEDHPDKTGPYWDLFIGTTSYVAGLVYDDVVVAFPNPFGIKDSLPASIAMGEEYSYSMEFDINEIVNVVGENVVGNFDNTRAIAMIIDTKSGKVINSASSGYPSTTNTQILKTESIAEEISYFNLHGIRVFSENARGIILKQIRWSDGTVSTEKIRL